jgi:hypothetical protein
LNDGAKRFVHGRNAINKGVSLANAVKARDSRNFSTSIEELLIYYGWLVDYG